MLKLMIVVNPLVGLFLLCLVTMVLIDNTVVIGETTGISDREEWWLAPDFDQAKPTVIAVLPMINLSLESETSGFLHRAVYDRLQAMGYRKTADSSVNDVMTRLGVQVPEQLAGISYERLGHELKCDAVLQGQVTQSAAQHTGIYDAVVVSCSLQLVACPSGKVLWRCEQWRTAHRQWHLDPLNMLISAIAHEQSNREERITWLVQEMLRTLPIGPVIVIHDDLFKRATEVTTGPHETESKDNDNSTVSR